MPHQWPPFIEFPFVSLQRVVCVDAPVLAWGSSGSAAMSMKRGRLRRTPRSRPWAYVPAVAFLKQFPAHSPTLLPPGSVSEEDYIRPRVALSISTWMLRRDEVTIPRRRSACLFALCSPAPITLRPLASCSPCLRRHRLARRSPDEAASSPRCPRRVRRADWRGSAHLERHWQPEKRAARWQGLHLDRDSTDRSHARTLAVPPRGELALTARRVGRRRQRPRRRQRQL